MRRLRGLIRFFARRDAESKDYVIACEDDGFRVSLRDDPSVRPPREKQDRRGRWEWSDVLRIDAYKIDLLVVDQVCLRIVPSRAPAIELDEERGGWVAFLEALPEALPGCPGPDDWLSDVWHPAFAPNERTLYDRHREMLKLAEGGSRDVDRIIEAVLAARPDVRCEQLTVCHPGVDDDGLWFFCLPGSRYSEVQIESTYGTCPFVVEGKRARDADTVERVVELVLEGLSEAERQAGRPGEGGP